MRHHLGWMALALLSSGCSLLLDPDQYSVVEGQGGTAGQVQVPAALNPGNDGDRPGSGGTRNGGGMTPAPAGGAPVSPTARQDCTNNPLLAGCAETTPLPVTGQDAQAEPAAACGNAVLFDDLYRQINRDLARSGPNDQIFQRYISLGNRLNAGQCTDTALEGDRNALTKLLNMLSTDPEVRQLRAIDAERTLFAIDLRDYNWDRPLRVEGMPFADSWEAIVAKNPYAVPFTGTDATAVRTATGSQVPLMFADQLLDVAAIGNLYYALIGVDVGTTLSNFVSNELAVDTAQNLLDQAGGTIRAGTSQSRISRQDRLLERHDLGIRAGVLWRAVDVASTNTASLFDDPLGASGPGGEAIFTLPNGMLAFVIADANDAIVPDSDILLDTNQNNFRAVTSISCSNCHTTGFIPTVDEVRDLALSNALALGLDREEVERLQTLYAPPAEFARVVQRDSEQFYQRALQAAALPLEGGDPVSSMFLRFDQDLRLEDAAGDLGVTPATLRANLSRLPAALSVLDTGVVDRDDFTVLFRRSLCTLSDSLQNKPDAAACASAPSSL